MSDDDEAVLALHPELVAVAETTLAAQKAKLDAMTPVEATRHAFWGRKHRDEAARNWDKFYKRNETNFFKDRHWLEREFPELAEASRERLVLLEAGCGVGNLVFPALRLNPKLFVYACDFSERAVSFVQQHQEYESSGRCKAFVADLASATLLTSLIPEPVDLITCIFVLSALPPEHHAHAFRQLAACLRPGGTLLLRDYARYDLAQLRFAPERRIEDGLYARHDGTLAYYFDRDEVIQLARQAGLEGEVEWRQMVKENRKLGKRMERVWIQARLRMQEAPVSTS